MQMNQIPTPDAKEKLETIQRLLDEEFVLIHLDASQEGISLPAHLMGNSSVTLKLSRLFRGALALSTQLIEAELLFGNSYFPCIVPLQAVWGVTSFKGANIVWPESTPAEVLEKIISPSKDEVTPAKRKPALVKKSIRGTHPKEGSEQKLSHLKRVK